MVIINENKYNEYTNSMAIKKKKPSSYCMVNLKMSTIKSYEFAKIYFKDVEQLVKAIQTYKQYKTKHKNGFIADLLK